MSRLIASTQTSALVSTGGLAIQSRGGTRPPARTRLRLREDIASALLENFRFDFHFVFAISSAAWNVSLVDSPCHSERERRSFSVSASILSKQISDEFHVP